MRELYKDRRREYLTETIIKNLETASDDLLNNLFCVSSSPSEYQIYDIYVHSLIDNKLLNTLRDKYPEEFI
jgi:hypothetical protein